MDPPPCVQNAMMTKDKKPFTYTPGGINLAEIKSPRMARRIEKNANYGGVGDVPKNVNPHHSTGPLPPSALAAMNPQIQVQVLPSLPQGGRNMPPPPPPPPPANIPPPPPLQPLPTQKVVTGNNQVVERPDMTKIIPDNPMALLKKTGGPKTRNFENEMYAPAPTPTPSPMMHQPSPSSPMPRNFVDEMYSPAAKPAQPTASAILTPTTPKPRSFVDEMYANPPQAQAQCSSPGPRSPEYVQSPPTRYQPPVIERTPSINKSPVEQPPLKTSSAHLGSLYIPPINNQNQNQHRIVSPPLPTPPERHQESPKIQSPGTPTLKEAPKPWQKQQEQHDMPSWAKREDQQTPPNGEPKQSSSNRSTPIHIEVRTKQQPNNNTFYQPPNVRIDVQTDPAFQQQHPNAVFITQPLVFQHPGPRMGPAPPNGNPNIRFTQKQVVQQQEHQQTVGTRIIPIQIEGGNKTPDTPGSDRSYGRQQSWSSNPSQSNSFKVIQKMTNTDDEDNENEPITSHSPKYPQNFQQSAEPNRFKQGQGLQINQQVRTIPVQIEGDGPSQPYVHPSEQIVPEPKKYMGSSIPSKSFRMLQAMTAPDSSGPDHTDF